MPWSKTAEINNACFCKKQFELINIWRGVLQHSQRRKNDYNPFLFSNDGRKGKTNANVLRAALLHIDTLTKGAQKALAAT